MVFELKCVYFVIGVEILLWLVRVQWDVFNLFKQLDFFVNDDNCKFVLFDDVLYYVIRYYFSFEIIIL